MAFLLSIEPKLVGVPRYDILLFTHYSRFYTKIVMQDLQQVFARVQLAKKQKKDLETSFKDALKNSLEYQELDEKMKTQRERKKQIETTIKDQFSGELTKIDDLKIDIASDMEMISDMAMSQLVKGETVEVTDEYGTKYEPVFKVNFKKA